MKRSAFGMAVLWVMSLTTAGYGADALVPAYRDAEMEQRWQADRRRVHEPSPEKERAAVARAGAAARDRDRIELAAAARDLVVHAPAGGVAAGWSKAAAAWGALSRSSTGHDDEQPSTTAIRSSSTAVLETPRKSGLRR